MSANGSGASDVMTMMAGTWSNFFAPSPQLPEDPGGEFDDSRISVLRIRAARLGNVSMLAALEEVERLQREQRRTALELDLLRRVAREAPWAGFHALADWPPAWLVEMVEQGRADAIQADRALVLGYSDIDEKHGAPLVPSPGRRWWTHAEPPRYHDAERYEAARSVLAATMGTADR